MTNDLTNINLNRFDMYFNRFISVFILFTMIVSNIKGEETTNRNDSVSKTLIKTLSGIEVKIEGPHSEGFSSGSTMSPISLDYIREIKIFKTATLILKGGFVVISKNWDNKNLLGQMIYKPFIGNEFKHLNFGLNFVIEPRWYWKISKRVLSGKVKQNSGWYLSFPFESNIPIDFAFKVLEENYDANKFQDVVWVKDFLRVYYNFGPAIGYKYSISKNWCLDAMIQMSAMNYFIKFNQSYHSGTIEINPQLKIKAAYIFNSK